MNGLMMLGTNRTRKLKAHSQTHRHSNRSGIGGLDDQNTRGLCRAYLRRREGPGGFGENKGRGH